jgi:hypothetical protein
MAGRGKNDIPRCKATSKAGTPCKARPVVGTDFCHFHSAPDKAQELGRKGGNTFAALRALEAADYHFTTPQDVAACLGDTVNATLTGRLDHRIANAVSGLCGQLVRALEGGDIEARLAALEAKLGGRSL